MLKLINAFINLKYLDRVQPPINVRVSNEEQAIRWRRASSRQITYYIIRFTINNNLDSPFREIRIPADADLEEYSFSFDDLPANQTYNTYVVSAIGEYESVPVFAGDVSPSKKNEFNNFKPVKHMHCLLSFLFSDYIHKT